MSDDLNVEIPKLVEDLASIVGVATGIQYRERTLTKQRIEAALPGGEQLFDLFLREALECASRCDPSIHELGHDDTGFHGDSSKNLRRKS